MASDDAKILADVVWSYWKDIAAPGAKPAMTWIEVFQLAKFFFTETKKREIDPQLVDFRSELDSHISFYENKEHLEDMLNTIKPKELDPEELIHAELERLVEGTEFSIVKEKDLSKLQDYEQKAKRLAERLAQLKADRDRDSREADEEIAKLKAELAEAPSIRLEILQDFREGVVSFRKGQTVETKNRGWALQKMSEGKAREILPEGAAVPPQPSLIPSPPAVELSKEEKEKLQSEFSSLLIRELKSVPAWAVGEFNRVLEGVKHQSYGEARDRILDLADEIIFEKETRRRVKPTRRILQIGIPEEGEEPYRLAPETVGLPKAPLSDMPFPRAPSSEERIVLLDAFSSRIERMGRDPNRYMNVFKEQIWSMVFRSWSELLTHLEELIKLIEEGKPFRMIPMPPMPWREEETPKRRDAVVHFIATKIYPSMEELIEALSTWGVSPPVTPEEAKKYAKDAWKTKDIWFTSVSLDYLASLLGVPPEEIGSQ